MIFHLNRIAAVTALLWALGTSPASAQVTFNAFGVADAYISDMSANGSVVVGILLGTATVPNPTGNQAFRWTAAGGVQNIWRPHGYGFDIPRRDDDCGRRARCSGK